MPQILRSALVYGVGAIAVLLFGIWVILESSMLSGYRISLVERLLAGALGYEVRIEGDVGAALYPTVILFVEAVKLPGSNGHQTELAVLKDAEMRLSPKDLLRGQINIDAIFVDDLQVNLVTNEDGSTNWAGLSANDPETQSTDAPPSDTEADADDIVIFLLNRTIDFSNIQLNVRNEKTGFNFLFLLQDLTIDQTNSNTAVEVASTGSVNGEVFQYQAHFLREGAFTSNASFGETTMSFDGQVVEENFDVYAGDLEVNVQELGSFLETLGLARVLEGHAKLNGSLSGDAGETSLSDLVMLAELEDGRTAQVTGDIGDLSQLEELQIKVDANLAETGAPEHAAQKIEDFRLNSIFASIQSTGQQISIDELEIRTNIGHRDFREIGPISVGQIKRAPDGRLNLLDVTLALGDGETPLLTTRGEIRDLLNLSDYDATGEIVLPAPWVFSFLPNSVGTELGTARAVFDVSDSGGTPSLSRFAVSTEGTDLWSLSARSSIGDIGTLSEATFEFDLEVADLAAFLQKLDLEPVATNGLKMSGKLDRSTQVIDLYYALNLGGTRVETQLAATRKGGKPNVRGTISSQEINTADLQAAVATALQIASLADEALADEKPLVLPSPDDQDVKPLVLPETTEQPETEDQTEPEDKPLVIEALSEEVKLNEFFDFDLLARNLDLEIGIDIAKLTGQAGVSQIRSDLEFQDGKMRFGPIEASLGGGYFNFGATMDVVNAPNSIRLTGATSGWDFGKILRSAGASIPASGTLRAKFDLFGQRSSVDAFLDTMTGAATVSMTNAKIGTSLLEFAGLGVFPWLFSKERKQGYTDIVCIVAPLHIKNGRVASNATVIETQRVQIVINGAVDFHKDTINLLAKPRPLGRPLARGAWPFSITGPLSKPVVGIVSNDTRKPKSPLKMPANRKPCRPDASQLIEAAPSKK